MSLNHLVYEKELDIKVLDINSDTATIGTENVTNLFATNATIDNLTITNVEADQVFTKGYDGNNYHALDTSFSTYALVPTPRFTGATLYFSKCEDTILPIPPDSPGMYDTELGKSCIITRSGNCVTQKFNFTATRTSSQVGVNGSCDLFFILNKINPVDPSTYSYSFKGHSVGSNGYSLKTTLPTITTKTEAGNTYGILRFLWDTITPGYTAPSVGEQYIFELEVSWLENPILPPVPP